MTTTVGIVSMAHAMSSARPRGEPARRAALAGVLRAARAEVGLPTDVVLARPGHSLPETLETVETEVYDLLVQVMCLEARPSNETETESERVRRDLERRRVLCHLVALEASPALSRGRE